MERARKADRALAAGERVGPLHGIPFALKDCHDLAGSVSTVGAPWWAQHRPTRSSPVVERLIAAGAVPFARTNVAELLADFQCTNTVFGATSNPWKASHTSGGSSGGAAAAIASGMTPFDIGTDMAGSIRLPASFCGVYGLKPTEHRVPLAGSFPNPAGAARLVRSVCCVGPMARCVDDLDLLLGVVEGPDSRDPDVPPAPDAYSELAIETEKPRIAVATRFGGLPVAVAIRDAIEAVGKSLVASGATIGEVDIPRSAEALQGDLEIFGQLVSMMVSAFQPGRHGKPSFDEFVQALDRRDQAISAWDGLFERWDALLCPVSMTAAFAHCPSGSAVDIDGVDAPYEAVNGHAAIFNFTGHPAVTVPCGLTSDGLPIGVQLVAARWGDRKLLRIARRLEALGFAFRRPGESLAQTC